jgi:hypothetical protein
MRSKYYLADRLPGYLINLSLLNDRYWAGSLRSTAGHAHSLAFRRAKTFTAFGTTLQCIGIVPHASPSSMIAVPSAFG